MPVLWCIQTGQRVFGPGIATSRLVWPLERKQILPGPHTNTGPQFASSRKFWSRWLDLSRGNSQSMLMRIQQLRTLRDRIALGEARSWASISKDCAAWPARLPDLRDAPDSSPHVVENRLVAACGDRTRGYPELPGCSQLCRQKAVDKAASFRGLSSRRRRATSSASCHAFPIRLSRREFPARRPGQQSAGCP